MRSHRFAPALSDPGEQDLTSHVIPGTGKSFPYAARQNRIGLRRGAVRMRLELRKFNCPTVCYTSMAQAAFEFAAGRRDFKVRCPNCAVEVNPLREYCHSCGSPTDPAVRERLRARAG